jgi:hypothetical protein
MWENDELVGCLYTVEEVWDMLIDHGVLYTTRNLDVYLTNLRTKGIKNTQNVDIFFFLSCFLLKKMTIK